MERARLSRPYRLSRSERLRRFAMLPMQNNGCNQRITITTSLKEDLPINRLSTQQLHNFPSSSEQRREIRCTVPRKPLTDRLEATMSGGGSESNNKKCGLFELIVFLAAIVFGTACSILSKTMMSLHGEGKTGEMEQFEKPIFQSKKATWMSIALPDLDR